MRQRLLVLLVAGLLLAACGRVGPSGATTTPTAPATATLAAYPGAGTPTPAPLVPAESPTPPPTLPAATPTALIEGIGVRLGTPDPTLNCPEHYPWFFENAAAECAGVVLNTWAVWQPFERGVMLWTQEGGRTYVLLDDGAPLKPYVIVSDPLGLPLPEPDPALAPPEGLYQPELGFALFWRGLVPGHGWVRERLGWATAPEAAYSGLWQCSPAAGEAARCYSNGPRDEIVVLAAGAPWWAYVQEAVR